MQLPSPDPIIIRKYWHYNKLNIEKSKERQKRFATETKNIDDKMPLTSTLTNFEQGV